ncbi:MAG: hypothetical protein RLZZ241_215 [Bacteroidota bacterium]|jgi:predicted membrane metal-binding protein
MGLIRVLFYILLGYYLLKILGRLLAPFLVRYLQRKSQDYFSQAYGQAGGTVQNEGQKVGDVVVEKPSGPTKKAGKPVGEYISYEEVD